MSARMLYITVAGEKEAEKIGRVLVEKKLAACVNIVPKIKSIYWWNGKIEQSNEALLLCKTFKEKEKKAMEKAKEIHSYNNPCIESLNIEQLNEDYEKWMKEAIK